MSVDKRNGGCGVIFEDKLYVWGGQTLDIDEPEDRPDGGPAQRPVEIITSLPRPEDDYPFDILDLTHMVWSQETTSARHEDREDEEIPDVGLGSSLVVYPETKCFLLFGGLNELHFDNKVYRIFPGEWMWDRIEPSSDVVPTPRYITGVIIHNNRLCVFGGVSGPIREGADKGARYAPSHNAEGVKLMYGWNNEYFEMDLETREWRAALHSGEGAQGLPERPDPIGGFAFVAIDPERALLFGGHGVNGRVNEARLFNLEKREWSAAIATDSPWPPPTRFASLTALVEPELVGQRLGGRICHQQLVLLWGKQQPLLVSKETWLLELEASSAEFHWRKLKVFLKPRSWHLGLPRYLRGSTECQLIVFGGNAHIKGDSGARDNIADLRVLQFGVKSLFRSCLCMIADDSALREHATNNITPVIHGMILAAHDAYSNIPPLPEIHTVE